MRLLAYTRVSTDDQARGGHSLSQQPERLAAYCVAHQHQLVDVIVEGRGVSGSIPLEKRPGGAELLRRLKAGEADGVVVLRLERLFRNLLDSVHFFRTTAPKHGIAVHSLSEHVDTSTASGRLALNIQLVLADAERDKGVERTTEVMRSLRADGRVFGHVPYGCIAIDGALFRSADSWPARERIVALRGKGLSLEALAAELRKQHLAAPNGGVRWSKSTLAELIKTHASLAHLPLLPSQVGTGETTAPDAAPSPEDAH